MSKENVEIVRRLYEMWNTGDAGWEFYTPDVEWDVSRWAPDLPAVARGHDQTREQFNHFLGMWAEVHFEPEQFVERGDRVGVIVTIGVTGKNSHVPAVARLGQVFTLRDGLLARFVLYSDPEEALEAVRLDESPAS